MRPTVPDISPARRGFTLVEILATLALVAIILPVAMSGISLALATASESRRATEAAALAQAKMAEIVAYQAWTSASLSGDFLPEQPDYRWTAEFTNWQTTIKQLDVHVLWMHRGEIRSITLTTLVYTGSSST